MDTRSMSSSPLVNSLVKIQLFKIAPDIDELLFPFIHTMDWSVVDAMLHDSPDLVIHRTEIWAVRRPQVGQKKVWHFLTQQFNCCSVWTVSQKRAHVWPTIGLTRSHRFLQFLAHVVSRDSKIGCRYNFLKYLAFTYFIMLWSEMISMSRCPCTSLLLRHRQRCVKMFFSVDDKVLIKSLYQFSGKLVQTFNQNFIASLKDHVYTTLPWRYNSDVENASFPSK